MAKKKSYGQFCPVAQAAEIVAERWTPLVLRELMNGSHRFTEIRKGVPLMSPSLLTQRLRELEDAGVIERVSATKGTGSAYHLTTAGEELRPLVDMLGLWGLRWVQREVRREELDPSLLMWDVRRGINISGLPNGDGNPDRIVVQFDIVGVPANKRRWWLVVEQGEVDLCLKNPGYAIDLHVSAPIRVLVAVWLGHETPQRAVRAGTIELKGSRALITSFKDWFGPSGVVQLARTQSIEFRVGP